MIDATIYSRTAFRRSMEEDTVREQLTNAPAWITGRAFSEDPDGSRQPQAVPLAQEIAEKRADLAAENTSTTTVDLPTVRAMVIASVLEECATRLQLGDEPGNREVADLCTDLVADLRRRSGLTS